MRVSRIGPVTCALALAFAIGGIVTGSADITRHALCFLLGYHAGRVFPRCWPVSIGVAVGGYFVLMVLVR